MALTVQAPADLLLAVFAEPAAAEGAASAAPMAEGMFAALLAGTLETKPAPGTDPPDAGMPIPAQGEEPGDQTPDDPALALLASVPALQVAPQPLSPPPAPSGQDAATETAVAPAGPAPGATLAPAPPGTATAPPAAAPLPVAESGEPTEALPAPPDQSPLPPPEASAPPDSLEASAPADSPAADLAPAGSDSPPTGPGPLPADSSSQPVRPGPADIPEPPAGDTPAATARVVRSVGNASESAPGKGDNKTGRKPEDARPLPRASANGIAHAAANSAVGELRLASAPDAPATVAVDAPAPAEPPAELPQQVDQVASAVIERVEAGGGEARIHLEPLELGEVTIHVRTEGDEVRIEIRAERPDAARLLRDHTQDLSSLLGSRGLNLSDVNVGVGGGNAGNPFERDNRARPVAGEFASILGLDDEPASAGRHNRLRAAYNPDGALVYRV